MGFIVPVASQVTWYFGETGGPGVPCGTHYNSSRMCSRAVTSPASCQEDNYHCVNVVLYAGSPLEYKIVGNVVETKKPALTPSDKCAQWYGQEAEGKRAHVEPSI